MNTQHDQLLRLPINQLRSHPQNIRRFYPAAGIRELADSIAQHGGVIQPLIVTPADPSADATVGADTPPGGQGDLYTVIDGNRRLRAAQLLNGECPLLECKVVDAERAEQLLVMVTTNFLREEPDPISEALHYQLLMKQEHLSVQEISRRAGVSHVRVSHRMWLLELDAPIQEMVAKGELPSDHRVVRALLGIKDVQLRHQLATRFAADRPPIKAIIVTCERVMERLGQTLEKPRMPSGRKSAATLLTKYAGEPMLAAAQARAKIAAPDDTARTTWPQVRAAAKTMCSACDTRTQALRGQHEEPAWLLISHAANGVCTRCSVKDVAGACSACPGVELLKTLIASTLHANLKVTA